MNTVLPRLVLLLLAEAATLHGADEIAQRIRVIPPAEEIPMPENVRVFFGPLDNLEGAVVGALQTATTEVLISQYAITNPRICEAIAALYQDKSKKIVVGIILDPAPSIRPYNAPAFFLERKIPFVYAKAKGRHNQKYCVIDRRVVLTGSFDWLASSVQNNDNLLVVDEPGVAAAYARDWIAASKTAVIPQERDVPNPELRPIP